MSRTVKANKTGKTSQKEEQIPKKLPKPNKTAVIFRKTTFTRLKKTARYAIMNKKKQVGIRLDESFYKEIRVVLIKEGKSFQEYVEKLIKDDMDKRGR